MSSEVRRNINAEVFFTAMLLFESPPEMKVIQTWTDTEAKQALDWVQAEYLARQISTGMPHPGVKPSVLQHFN